MIASSAFIAMARAKTRAIWLHGQQRVTSLTWRLMAMFSAMAQRITTRPAFTRSGQTSSPQSERSATTSSMSIRPAASCRSVRRDQRRAQKVLLMDEQLDVTLEFERIAEALEEMAPFSELAEDTLRLLIVMANEINRLQGEQ